MDRTVFFARVRPMFGGNLTQAQVDGLETLLAATAALPLTFQAYLLATVKRETGDTMRPIVEYGGRKYFDKYDTGKLARALGNTPEADGDGYTYRGRGYVQITGRANYAKAAAILRVDLLRNPDLALQPTVAARILVRGCVEGWFGHFKRANGTFGDYKLSDFLPGDYVGARRVVNGTDHAEEIARHARQFEAALLDAGASGGKALPVPADKPGMWAAILAFLASLKSKTGGRHGAK